MSATYQTRRGQLEDYFDRTASETWQRLTSDAPVSRVRQTVRRGRDQMRAMLLSWLPENLEDQIVLDAGCGTGSMAIELALRGARVIAVDVAGSLVEIARQRTPEGLRAQIDYRAGDMLEPSLGTFDHVVAMDSLIHYECEQIVDAVGTLAGRTKTSLLLTYAPWTPALGAMHRVGKLFPQSDRSPAIVPITEQRLRNQLLSEPMGLEWDVAQTERVKSGFYHSCGMRLDRKEAQ